ncbi:MAG TPA: hypothetical protein VE990_17295 [Acidimicrobiales bacterium]|nr:hypothetical protein [Acidimicrobiales bacterium]
MTVDLPRLLVVMGSGETSPTMVKTHRAVLDRLSPGRGPAVLLDTPFGFQENADDITGRALAYFEDSVGVRLEVARYRSSADRVDPVAYGRSMEALRRAGYVFAGPGSPSYALEQWSASEVPAILGDKLELGGCVSFASAAALTLGLLTVPVYEIYKVGSSPHWLEGLDLLGRAGLRAAVIPHYNNAEGGNHDTRFCYLGERRLAAMEALMPEDAFVLGIDEHTGVVMDLDADTAEVVGLGVMTLRYRGASRQLEAGQSVAISQLGELARGSQAGAGPPAAPATARHEPASGGTARSPLLEAVRQRQTDFDRALAAGDADSAVRAILDLEEELVSWAADTLQSDEMDRARAALRSMVVALGDRARRGLADPRQSLGPFVEIVLRARTDARHDRRYAQADALRDALVSLGVEVMDTPEGTAWELARPGGAPERP